MTVWDGRERFTRLGHAEQADELAMLGGAVLAHNTSPEDLHKRVDEDPFVAQDVVTPEIIEIAPGVADDRLSFLL
ncbi:hypothetical protein ACFVVL_12875 [Kitasatospora sp. NPDC058115]|uniref:hypothetical protein n=1 Tax=Kitasatospora sp. NPDC058115 TaxID=3346347 RepID=UPI0036D95C60